MIDLSITTRDMLMKNDDVSGKAKGGKARAAKMTAEQRKESSRKAVAAKKKKLYCPYLRMRES